jgi:hypothetical protein
MNITVKIDEISLSTVVDEVLVYEADDDDFGREPAGTVNTRTVGHLVAEMIMDRIVKDDRYPSLVKRVTAIRNEEIREAVRPAIEEAVNGPVRQTNSYGEPTGATTTLRELIAAEASKFINSPVDAYNRDRGTHLSKLVREQVQEAFAAEVKAAVQQARTSVADEIGQQVANAVTNAMKAR